MLWVKALHMIAMVCWFSGIFYLPRLFVYHTLASDAISIARFKIMEKKLYYYITTPSMLLTIFFGVWLIFSNPQYFLHALWFHLKLVTVFLLVLYHIYLGGLMRQLADDKNKHGHVYYRILNEVPVLFLFIIIILAEVKPFGAISGY